MPGKSTRKPRFAAKNSDETLQNGTAANGAAAPESALAGKEAPSENGTSTETPQGSDKKPAQKAETAENASETADESAKEKSSEKRRAKSEKSEKRPRFSGHVPLSMVAFLLAVAILITFQITFLAMRAKYQRVVDGLQLAENDLAKLSQVEGLFESSYLGQIDKAAVQDALLKGYVNATGDKYAAYYTAEEYKALEASQKGEAVGIGVIVTPHEKGVFITWVSSDSPAEKAGLQNGDIITAVDGKGLGTLEYDAMVNAVRGKEGTVVKLAVLRNGKTIDISVTRGEYISTSVTYSLLKDGKTGLVRLLTFDGTTAEQFRGAIDTLRQQGAARIVFDVRANGGGLLTSVVEVLDMLLPEGVIVTTVDSAGNETPYSSDPEEYDFPMAVLCNGSTASAAELFTAALRDYGKAVIVGETTYGKGVAQSTYRLSDGSAVKLTTSYYNPPSGVNYDGVGITPDVLVTMPEELASVSLYTIAEENDPQLQAALSALDAQAN